EELETPVAEILDVLDADVGLEQHVVVPRELELALAPLFLLSRPPRGLGTLLVGDRAFLGADGDALSVQDVAIDLGELGRDAVAVVHDTVLVYPAVEPAALRAAVLRGRRIDESDGHCGEQSERRRDA